MIGRAAGMAGLLAGFATLAIVLLISYDVGMRLFKGFSTTWPRPFSVSTVAFGTRFSTTSTPGRAVRGQNEIGKCSECHAGASIASCRFMLAWTWRRKNCVVHWSCWSPPGDPQAMYGSPSRKHMVGLSVVRGRFPGANAAG